MTALDFPDSPADGDIFQGYIYDATRGVWDAKLVSSNDLNDLSDIDTTGLADGQALIYNATTEKWGPGSAAPSGVKDLSSDTIDVDFSDNIPLEKRTVAGDVTFTGTNYTSGAKKTVYLEGDTVQRSLTFPAAWNFITDKPTAIGADKKNVLDLNSFGTSESTTVALWLGASSFEPLVAIGGTESEIIVSGVTYKMHTFLSSGSLNITDLGTLGSSEYILVAGGGGGSSTSNGPAGGGAGGLILGNNASVSTGIHSVVIGSGGGANAQGSNSSVFGLTAIGGGGGNGGSGGSGAGSNGGGGSNTFNPSVGSATSGQGNPGGRGLLYNVNDGGGGGGGYSAAGSDASPNDGGNGGDGLQWFINSQYYAGGGAGGSYTGPGATGGLGGGGDSLYESSGGSGVNGAANTGGGGGGGNGDPGSGGSGVFVFAYPITDPN